MANGDAHHYDHVPPDSTTFLESLEKDDERFERIMRLVADYGLHCISIGFLDKGTAEYSQEFRASIYAFGDIMCLLKGKEPPQHG